MALVITHKQFRIASGHSQRPALELIRLQKWQLAIAGSGEGPGTKGVVRSAWPN